MFIFDKILKNCIVNKPFCVSAIRSFSSPKKKICIVGSGPAGFYAAQYLLKHLSDCEIDLIEKLPVPFGLVRFGVAPDHPEVKNVINTFTKTAKNANFKFLGNLTFGKDFSLKDLQDNYHAVLLSYGAERDRKLGLPSENSNNVISAREFVAWYNGLPGAENLNPNLNVKTVTLIGQGNVAIDVARILLSPIDILKKTDITDFALEKLSSSDVRKVLLVGRRGPLQAAFTIKELREMLKLPNVNTIWRKNDFNGIREQIPNLQRPRKRLTELMLSSLDEVKEINDDRKEFLPIFLRSPKEIMDKSIKLIVNNIDKDRAIATNETEILSTDVILRSIGYKSLCVDQDLCFDDENGFVVNKSGRVLANKNDQSIVKGLYVTGWLATGPTGVILTTMNGAFTVAKTICDDINAGTISTSETRPGLNIKNKPVVTWSNWEKIDNYEIAAGKKSGKPREKLVSVNKMLEVAGV